MSNFISYNWDITQREVWEKLKPHNIQIVNWNFDCSWWNIWDFLWFPLKINGDFICCNNEITSLKWMPKIVTWNIKCTKTKIFTLKYFSLQVWKNIDLSWNRYIYRLKDLPEIINGDLNISFCHLEHFSWFVKEIKWNFIFSHNKVNSLLLLPKVWKSIIANNNKIKNLLWLNQEEINWDLILNSNLLFKLDWHKIKTIHWDLYLENNRLEKMMNLPKNIKWNLYCWWNIKSFTVSWIRMWSNIEWNIILKHHETN